METSITIGKLRKGIRYTFIHIDGYKFRAIFDRYQSINGINNTAMRLFNVSHLEGNLHIPLDFIREVSIYTVPNNTLPYFQLLIPEVNLIVNQYV